MSKLRASPLKYAGNWGKLLDIFEDKANINLKEVKLLAFNSFRHDIWQRLNQPSFNVDPFKLSAYRIYFITVLFENYCETKKIEPTEIQLDLFFQLLYVSFKLESKESKLIYLIDERKYIDQIENEWEQFFEKDYIHDQYLSEFKGLRKAINLIFSLNSNLDGDTERNISKILFVSFASLIEIVLFQKFPVSNKKFPTLGTYIEKIKKESKFKDIVIIFDFYNFLRNTIHIDNLVKSFNLNYNLDSAKTLFYLLLLTLLAYKRIDKESMEIRINVKENIMDLLSFYFMS